MVATIAPLVKVAPSQAIWANVLFSLASCAGGGAIGLAFGSLGYLLLGTVPATVWWTALGLVALGLAPVDLGFLRLRAPGLSGSVPREWWTRLGPKAGALAYGLVLGMGATTFIPVAAYYVVLAGAYLSGPFGGLIIGFLYGLARAAPVPIASLTVLTDLVGAADVGLWPRTQRELVRRASGIALLLVGAGFVLQ